MKFKRSGRSVASALLGSFAIAAAAQPVPPRDLSQADFSLTGNFTKQIVFSDSLAANPDTAAILADLIYPAGSPAATVNIQFSETIDGALMDVEWWNVTITNGGNTVSFNPTNGGGAMCGPDLQRTPVNCPAAER